MAAEAIIPSLRNALRSGDVSRAIEYWFPIATKECDVSLEATVAVRLGEALLDAGHPKEALFTLRGALDVGVSAAQATRIVKVARDLDDALARQAATIALNDSSLEPGTRAELQTLAAIPSDSPPSEETEVYVSPSPAVVKEEVADLAKFDPNEASLAAQALDAGAFSAENLSAEDPIGEDAGSSDVSIDFGVNSDDVFPELNERDSLLMEDDAGDLSGDLVEDWSEETLLDASALEPTEGASDLDLDLGDSDLLDPLGAVTDSDFTPMIDVTDESTSPLVQTNLDGDEQSTVVFDQPTALIKPRESVGVPPIDLAIGATDGLDSTTGSRLRRAKAIDALPIAMNDEWVEIDASPRGKSKVPFSRIETIAMAAVSGLGKRPVLIVDIVLNGSDGLDQPMKLIRFRSDRFDPLGFVPSAANPLVALTAWVQRLQNESNAICLPSESILAGKFARFETLEAYEREILMAVREDES